MKNILYMKKRARKQVLLLEKIIFSLHHSIENNTDDATALFANEKETPLALLMKLSQILLKWHEAEMDIIKQYPEEVDHTTPLKLDQKHIEIARRYFSKYIISE